MAGSLWRSASPRLEALAEAEEDPTRDEEEDWVQIRLRPQEEEVVEEVSQGQEEMKGRKRLRGKQPVVNASAEGEGGSSSSSSVPSGSWAKGAEKEDLGGEGEGSISGMRKLLWGPSTFVSKRSGARNPLNNRGGRSFEKVGQGLFGHWRMDVPRVMVHAIADGSGLKNYFPAYRRFLAFAQVEGFPIKSEDDHSRVDEAMMWYAEWCCYYRKWSVEEGKNARSCHTHLYPEAKGKLPKSGRALKAWEKLQGGAVPREPLAWATAGLVIEDLGEQEPIMGIAGYTQLDTGCREQDIEHLRWDDVKVASEEVS